MPIYRIQQGERLMKKTQIIVMAILMAFLVSSQNAMALTKSRAVLSPYFQTDVDSTYTFIGISHPSLTTAASTVGLTVATVGSVIAGSTSFTVGAGETYRIFIVSTNHSTINSLTVTGSRVLFMGMTTGGTDRAAITMLSSKQEPLLVTGASGETGGLQGLNMLSIWGAVVIPGTTSGFAMEFVGDAHGSNAPYSADSIEFTASSITDGRGIN